MIKNFLKIIENCKPKWITYLSATSVYGDHKGEWVNEESITKPTSPNGLARLETEKSWLSLKINKNKPIQIFRLSGIYSNQNNILVRLKLERPKLLISKITFFQEFTLKILQTHYLNLYLILSQEKYIIYLMTDLLQQKR